MTEITFFAASRDQLKYFKALSNNITIVSEVVWHKSLYLPLLMTHYPIQKLWSLSNLLSKRKKNSRKGKYYPVWVWPLFSTIYFVQACWLYGVYVRWLKKLPASYVGVWNGKKFRQAILLEALSATHKHPVFFETGPLPGVSAIDPKGVNFYSSIPRDVEFYLNRKLSLGQRFSENTSQNIPLSRPVQLPEHYLLVPFQVVEDSNIYLHSPWIHNMRQLFSLCESLSFKLSDDLVFVFKPHPACNEVYDDLYLRQSRKLRFIEDVSTPDLVRFSDAVITVNSTVGIEGLMAGKKVFVLGDALFGVDGVTFRVRSEDSLFEYLTQLDSLQINDAAVSSFLDYLKHDYSIIENAMQNPTQAHFNAAENRIRLLMNGQEKEALGLSALNSVANR